MKKIKNILSIAACLGLLLSASIGSAATPEKTELPATASVLKLSATEAVSSNANALHDIVHFKTVEAIKLADGSELPAGSPVEGEITKIEKSSGWGCPGKLEITVSAVKTAAGKSLPLNAVGEKRGQAPNFFVQYSLLGGFVKGQAAKIEPGAVLLLTITP